MDPQAAIKEMTGPIQIGRYFNQALASEIDADYVRITRERIEEYSDGELLLRPMGKPIHQPSGNEQAAQLPLD